MTIWHPIKTAPKDTSILLFVPELPESNGRPVGMDSHIVVGRYRGRWYDDNGWWISDIAEYDHGYYPGEFDWEASPLEPTHWMPLPAPPKSGELP